MGGMACDSRTKSQPTTFASCEGYAKAPEAGHKVVCERKMVHFASRRGEPEEEAPPLPDSRISRDSFLSTASSLMSDDASLCEEGGGVPAPRLEDPHILTDKEATLKRERAMEHLAALVAKAQQEKEDDKLANHRRSRRRSVTMPSKALASIQKDILQEIKAVPSLPTKETKSMPCVLEAAAAAAREAVAAEEAARREKLEQCMVVFDWDDTLLPTWYLCEVVRPCVSAEDWEHGLNEDSPFWSNLEDHAGVIRETLQAAKDACGNVGIVTLATRPWVQTSADKFLPGLNIKELLDELAIPVYYAREHVPKAEVKRKVEGVDMYMIAKRNAMARCMRKFGKAQKTTLTNIISVGDSPIEQSAIKEVTWSFDQDCLCKVVKLAYEPSLRMLTDQLQVLQMYFPKLAKYDEDFEIIMDDIQSQDLIAQIMSDSVGSTSE
eukprot:TRINITY_DN33495_c0_g1_i1.p1 TRINITY_DN33495_c0_g1~~TRINITY_DN33495_c0_g1_i1.p1  ORF type:complete len:437 (+),score=118.88 TRINITY_DN33495_c0_g1_i1:64-1374(+)